MGKTRQYQLHSLADIIDVVAPQRWRIYDGMQRLPLFLTSSLFSFANVPRHLPKIQDLPKHGRIHSKIAHSINVHLARSGNSQDLAKRTVIESFNPVCWNVQG